jgi:hypothetical protein
VPPRADGTATTADRREHTGRMRSVFQDPRPQVVARGRHRGAGPERDAAKDGTVLAQPHLPIGAAIDVVEGHSEESAPGEAPGIADAGDLRRGDPA